MKLSPWNHLRSLACGVVLAQLLITVAAAGERRFSYSYEAQRYIPGSVELENWVTWKTDDGFDRLDFRH